MSDQIVSIPFFPSAFRNSCPMGSARVVSRRSVTEIVANEAAMRSSQPKAAVAPTPIMIANGAAREALVVSSLICAAESSRRRVSDACR